MQLHVVNTKPLEKVVDHDKKLCIYYVGYENVSDKVDWLKL